MIGSRNAKRKHILVITDLFPPYIIGGSEISTAKLVKGLTKIYKCTVICGRFRKTPWRHSGAKVLPKLIDPSILYKNNNYKRWVYQFFFHSHNYISIKQFIDKNHVDLIQVVPNTPFALPTILASLLSKKPVVIDTRNYILSPETIQKEKSLTKFTKPPGNLPLNTHEIMRLGFYLYDKTYFTLYRDIIKRFVNKNKKVYIVSLSNFVKNELCKVGFNRKKIRVIYNIKDSIIGEKSVQKIKNTFVFAGRLTRDKGIWDLIKAAELLKNKKVSIIIVGDGPELNSLKKYTKEKNIKNVRFLGKLPNEQVHKIYQKCYAIVAPSVWPEPFGRFIQESFATATPIISTKVGGITEGIKNNITGILVNPKAPEELAGAINKLLTDKKLYSEIVTNIIKQRDKFSEVTIIKQRVSFYEKLLS